MRGNAHLMGDTVKCQIWHTYGSINANSSFHSNCWSLKAEDGWEIRVDSAEWAELQQVESARVFQPGRVIWREVKMNFLERVREVSEPMELYHQKRIKKGQKNWKWRWRKKGMAKDSEAKLEYRLWEDGQLFLWNSWPAWWTALPMLMNKAGSAHVCQAFNTPNRVSVQGCCGRRSSAMLYNGGLENTVMSYVRTQYAEDIIMGHIAQK